MPRVADVVAFLKRFAPLELVEEWDNVGLLLGDSDSEAGAVLTCLTLTPDVAREAIGRKAGLIVSHHPVLFRAVKRISNHDREGQMLLELIAAGVAVYCPHTAYDSASDGINQQLSRLMGLTHIEPLRPWSSSGSCKIVCFVPRSHLAAVQEALWSAGAGVIGEYAKCSFVQDGTGSFEGAATSKPAIGQSQRLEEVSEARVEVVCPDRLAADALRRVRSVHPYEEPVIDVYPLNENPSIRGSGRVGLLPVAAVHEPARGSAISLADFLALVKVRLGISEVPFVGELSRPIVRVAVACGSGGEFLPDAIARKCDVLLTGEARFHTCLEARDAGIGLILAGHYATERPAMEYLAAVLSREFPEISVSASESERDPIQWR